MTISTHTAIGATIGFAVGNPILGFIIGFTSHFLLDMIPHGDSKLSDNIRIHKKKKGALTYGTIDGLIAIYILLLITPIPKETSEIAFSAAVAGSILPDLLVGIYDLTKSKFLKPLYDVHFYFHDFFVKKHGDIKLPTALAGQFILIFFLMAQI